MRISRLILSCRLIALIAIVLARATGAQGTASARPIEATWKLVAWRIGNDTLRAPNVDGVFTVRDGVIVWRIHGVRGDTVLDRIGMGRYSVTGSAFRYEYSSGLEVDRVGQQQPVVHDSLPFRGVRAFRLVRHGADARYMSDDGRQVYTVRHDSLFVVQNGLLSRSYVRATRASPPN